MNSSAAFREKQSQMSLVWLVAPSDGIILGTNTYVTSDLWEKAARLTWSGGQCLWRTWLVVAHASSSHTHAPHSASTQSERCVCWYGEVFVCRRRRGSQSYGARWIQATPDDLRLTPCHGFIFTAAPPFLQLLRKWLCRFIHMKVFPPKLCRGFGLNGALRESIRAKDITTVFLFLCPPAFSFIFLHKPSSSLQRAQDKHKQRKCAVCIRLCERLRFCFSLLRDCVAAFPIINPAAVRPLWSRLKCDVPSDLWAQPSRDLSVIRKVVESMANSNLNFRLNSDSDSTFLTNVCKIQCLDMYRCVSWCLD